MPKVFTEKELASHKSEGTLYIAIHGKVYDVAKFLDQHPGGADIFFDVAGRDATDAFEDIGHSEEARSMLPRFEIGHFEGEIQQQTMKKDRVSGVSAVSALFISGVSVALIAGGFAYFT